jgi:hypothetical protein
MLSDAETWSEFQENYRYCHDYWSPFVSNAQVFTLAASGWTWSDRERQELSKEGREPLEMNIIRRPLQFFSGYLRDNLASVVIEPVEGSDVQTADDFTTLSYYIWDKGDGYNTLLDAADESFKSGISLCGIYMDYSNDFVNGDIKFFKRTFNSFYLDPTFERIDLSDAAFAITRDLLDRTMIKQLIPFVDPKEIDDIQNAFRDDKFLSYHPNFTTLSRNRNLMAYDQYYKRCTKKRRMLVDKDSGFYRDITDLPKDEVDKLQIGIKRFKRLKESSGTPEETKDIPDMEIMEVNRDFVDLHVMLNGKLVYRGEDKTGIVHTYPFAPILCYFEPSIWMPSQRIQGIPASLYFTQRQFNKRHMKIVDMMDSTISTGYKYLIGSVPDPTDMQQSGQNKLIGVDPENAPAGLDSVQELKGGEANPSLIEYQQVLDQLALTLSNVNESVLGVDEKGNAEISGRLAQVRIAQGLRANRKIIDNVERAQEVIGGLVMKAVQANYPAAKVARILGREPTEQFYDNQFEQYDAVIKEGVRSKSQKDAYYYELVNLKREGIVDVPQSEIVRALEVAGLSDLQKAMAKQDETLAKQKQLEAQAQQLQLEVLHATKEERLGLAEERRSRTESNLALASERVAKGEQDRAQATLDRAKTITEIAQMHDGRLLQVIQFLQMLEQQEEAQKQKAEVQTGNKAESIEEDIESSTPSQAQASPQPMAGDAPNFNEGFGGAGKVTY